METNFTNKDKENLIEDTITRYIDNNTVRQALLLTGTWGSGKTYFARKLKKKLAKKLDKKILIVSLFGISSIEMLEYQIRRAYLQEYVKYLDRDNKSFKYVSDSINKIGKIFSNNLISIDVDKCLDLLPLKYDLLVLDDLERCKVDYIDLLGYINRLCEIEHKKLLIICNEEKVKSNFSRDKDSDIAKKRNNYNELKEKVIAYTLEYRNDISTVYKELIDTYKDTDSQKIEFKRELGKREKIINDIFSEEDCHNIRILQFIIDVYKEIYTYMYLEVYKKLSGEDKLNQDDYDQIWNKECEKIFTYIVYREIYYKEENKCYDWNNRCYGSCDKKVLVTKEGKSNSERDQNKIYGYRFVDTFIQSYKLIKEEIKEVLTERLKNQIQGIKNKRVAFAEIENNAWRQLTDKELGKKLKLLLDGINKDEYCFSDYISIIWELANIREKLNIEDINVLFKSEDKYSLRNYIDTLSNKIQEDINKSSYTLNNLKDLKVQLEGLLEGKHLKKVNEYDECEKVRLLIKNINNKLDDENSLRNTILSVFPKNDSFDGLSKLYDLKSQFYNTNSFNCNCLSFIDEILNEDKRNLLSLLMKNNKNIDGFIHFLEAGLHREDKDFYFSNDKEYIKNFISNINGVKNNLDINNNRIQNYLLTYLVDILQKI
ncbi:MAG: P-loop NTPase fold protein [Veillonellaceae bacterium]|nr:P-loop NTPase fold protein [Veillonellaceae bacterium]